MRGRCSGCSRDTGYVMAVSTALWFCGSGLGVHPGAQPCLTRVSKRSGVLLRLVLLVVSLGFGITAPLLINCVMLSQFRNFSELYILH